MANRNDYLKILKRAYAASDDTLLAKIDGCDLPALEDLAESEFTVKVIDPPIVNGMDLRDHPVPAQREYYRKMLSSGGTVKGVYDSDGNLKHLASLGSSTASDVHKAVKLRKVANKVAKEIEDDFERATDKSTRGKARPKQMAPSDFWAQFPDKVVNRILELEDQEAVQFIEYVNSQTVVDLKDKEIKKGIKWLRKNKIIQKRAFEGDVAVDDEDKGKD